MDLFDLVAKITLDSSGYEGQLNDAAKKTSSFGDRVRSGLKTTTKAVAGGVAAIGAAAIAGTTAIIKATADVANYGDNIDKMSQKMGMSTDAYQEWDAVMQHCGTSIESMQASMKTLSAAAETGSDAFDKLGISQEEIKNLNEEQLFERTISALQDVESDTERTYLAGKLLGRGATELGALLNMSAEDTDAMRKRVHELGGVMSEEAVKSAAAYKDSLQDMTTAFAGLKRGLFAEFMPGITEVMDGLTEIFSGNQGGGTAKIKKGLDNLVKKFHTVVPKFMEIGKQIISALVSTLIENLPQLFKLGTEILVQLATGIIENLPQLIAAIPQIFSAIIAAFKENAPALKEAGIQLLYMIGEGILSAIGWLLEKLGQLVAAIKDYLIGKWTEVKEDTEELWKRMVNSITDRIQKLKKKIIDTWAEIKASVINLVERIKQEVINKWENLKQSVTDKIDALKQGLIEKWEAIKTSVTNAVENVKTAVVEKWENIKTTVTDTVENIKTAVTEKWMNLRSDVERTVENLKTSVLATWDNIKSGIKRKVDDLIDPVVDKFWNFYNEVTGIIGWIQDFINNTSLDLNVNARINKRVSATYDDYSYETPPLVQEAQSGRDAAIRAAMQYNRAYAKAYDTPYLFETPTTVTFGDRLGAEFVYGRDNLMRDIREATGGGANVTINVYPQKGQSEKEIAREVQKEFVRWDKQRQVAFA